MKSSVVVTICRPPATQTTARLLTAVEVRNRRSLANFNVDSDIRLRLRAEALISLIP